VADVEVVTILDQPGKAIVVHMVSNDTHKVTYKLLADPLSLLQLVFNAFQLFHVVD
jgi:hypothetical protein